MRCPECGEETEVVDSRKSHNTIRRRRECLNCGLRFTTYEVLDYDYQDLKKLLECSKELHSIIKRNKDLLSRLDEIEGL